MTSKTQVWAKVEGPGAVGGGRKPNGVGGGVPTNFLSSQFRPPPPPSIPINGMGAGFSGVAFTPPNKSSPPVRIPSAPKLPSMSTNKVPTARPSAPVVGTQKATTVAAVTVDTVSVPVAEASTSPTASSTVATTAVTAETTVTDSSAITTARPEEAIRNVTETALTPPTVTTQQPAQSNLVLALIPIVVAAVFLTMAGILACLYRKRLFSGKVKSKKVNSIVCIPIYNHVIVII